MSHKETSVKEEPQDPSWHSLRARDALDGLPGGYVLMRAVRNNGDVVDWDVLDANTFACARWGLSLEEVRGKQLSQDRALFEWFAEPTRQALQNSSVVEATGSLLSPAGTALRHVTIVPLGGDLTAAFTWDMGGALMELRARASALVERVFDVVAVTDAQTRIKWVSPAVRAALGYRPDELLGRPATELVDPVDAEMAAAQLARVLADPSDLAEPFRLRLLTVDGSRRWFECVGVNRFRDPVLGGLVVSLHDIDSRYRTQRALEASERRIRSILEGAGDAVVTVGKDGTIEMFNRAAEKLFRTPATSVLGGSYKPFITDESADRLRRDLVGGPDPTQPVRVTARRADGESFTAQVTVSQTMVDDDEMVFTAIVRDVSL
jgi:PAS domain S-box-containing protein